MRPLAPLAVSLGCVGGVSGVGGVVGCATAWELELRILLELFLRQALFSGGLTGLTKS